MKFMLMTAKRISKGHTLSLYAQPVLKLFYLDLDLFSMMTANSILSDFILQDEIMILQPDYTTPTQAKTATNANSVH